MEAQLCEEEAVDGEAGGGESGDGEAGGDESEDDKSGDKAEDVVSKGDEAEGGMEEETTGHFARCAGFS